MAHVSGVRERHIKHVHIGFFFYIADLWYFHTRARQQDNDMTNVEPVHFYDAFHTWFVGPGVKGIIGMHRFNICLVVVLLWCENTIRDCFQNYVLKEPACRGGGAVCRATAATWRKLPPHHLHHVQTTCRVQFWHVHRYFRKRFISAVRIVGLHTRRGHVQWHASNTRLIARRLFIYTCTVTYIVVMVRHTKVS